MSEVQIAVQLGQLVAYITSAILFVIMMKADMKIIAHDIKSLKEQHKTINDSILAMSNTLATMSTQDIRLLHLEEDVRGLKRGDGFILPLGGTKNA